MTGPGDQRARGRPPRFAVDPTAILNSLATAVVVLDHDGVIRDANNAAEGMFDSSVNYLRGKPLSKFVPTDNPLFALIEQVMGGSSGVSEHGVELDTPRTGNRTVTIHVAPLVDTSDWVAVSFQEQSIALRIGEQLLHRNSARYLTAMAAMLAHEIKNPLSGIRGAAQLLEGEVSEDDQPLTRLICDETDRITALIDRMDVFADARPMKRGAVNIHQVLEHVRRIAENGFAKGLRIREYYDPSLPPVLGNRDHLIQIFLNLVKNASEAVVEARDHGAGQGELTLTTSYRQGIKVAVPGTSERLNVPLMVTVEDNGPGIPPDIQQNLFDPFVSSKPKGSGLGLALVAKLVNDHGGIIEFDSFPGRTVFRVMLPTAREDSGKMTIEDADERNHSRRRR